MSHITSEDTAPKDTAVEAWPAPTEANGTSGLSTSTPSGYTTLPGGFIMQFAMLSFPEGTWTGSASAVLLWTFPVAFTYPPISCTTNNDPDPGSSNGITLGVNVGVPSGGTYSNTQVSITFKSTVYTSSSSTLQFTQSFFFITCIGV